MKRAIDKIITVQQKLVQSYKSSIQKLSSIQMSQDEYLTIHDKLDYISELLIEKIEYEYNTLVATGFSGSIYGDAQYMNSAPASGLNGIWNRITTTDDETIQANGFKTEKWQHQSGNYILKFGESQWEIYDKNQTYRAACQAGRTQTLDQPWENHSSVMWVGEAMIPINGKFYLKSTTQQEGFGAKYKISGADIDNVNGYYYLDTTEYGFQGEPVYKNKNGVKLSYTDEAVIHQLIIYTGTLYNQPYGVFVGPCNIIYKWNQIGYASDISAAKWTRNDDGSYILQGDMICEVL